MAKNNKEAAGVDETSEDTALAVADPVVEKRDPTKTIGFESGVHGEYLYIDAPAGWERDRSISYSNGHYEHTLDDRDGVWIYRQM